MECAGGKFPYDISKKSKLWDLISMLNDTPIPPFPADFSQEFKDFLTIWYIK